MQYSGEQLTPRTITYFWNQINRTESCWYWKGTRSNGYGIIRVGVKPTLAHRVSWLIHKGEIPVGRKILCSCETRGCCNPDHLYLRPNINIRSEQKESRNQPHGEQHYRASISNELVREIRNRREQSERICSIARDLNISWDVVYSVIKRRTWKQVC